jgi:DNA-binding MarR family transcriptional regulator
VHNEYYEIVPGKLQKEIHQRKAIRLLEEEATLNIMRTADHLNLQLMDVLKPYGLSGTQYNVLRILRGAGDTGASCKDIAGRMVTRDPDITRLMDRLEKRGILTRDRAKEDRRVVTHRLTESGLELVNELDRPIEALHQTAMGRLKSGQLRDLIDLLEQLRM